jgi:hypothetical protein
MVRSFQNHVQIEKKYSATVVAELDFQSHVQIGNQHCLLMLIVFVDLLQSSPSSRPMIHSFCLHFVFLVAAFLLN